MNIFKNTNKLSIIALLFWSALFVYSCAGNGGKSIDDGSAKPVMKSDSLTINNYKSGRLTYMFETPELIQFKGKDTSYMIFEKGIYIVTYDSLGAERTWLRAKYAIFRESIQQWEARDSVVALDKDGKILKTNLLFWEQKEKKVHSPIRTIVIDGEEVVVGENGFVSDDELNNIEFIKSKGRILVDTAKNETKVDSLTLQQN